MGGGAVSSNNLHFEKKKIEQDYQSYKNLTSEEIKRLRKIKN
jgi:hypothetical protein